MQQLLRLGFSKTADILSKRTVLVVYIPDFAFKSTFLKAVQLFQEGEESCDSSPANIHIDLTTDFLNVTSITGSACVKFNALV